MATHSAPTLERQLAAAQAWWREAGVDCIYTDAPQVWLRKLDPGSPAPHPEGPAIPAAKPAPEQRAAIGGPRADWPGDLAAFRAYWLAEPSLELGGTGARVPPRGEEEPELLVLVPMPEAGDGERLLSGRQGQLVAGMLAAMGIEPGGAYLAAALPRHMAQPDWEGLAQAGLGAIVRHHLALARPRRLLVLGHGILPLLGHGRTQAPALVKQTTIEAAANPVQVPTLVGLAPDRLLENARQRAMLWRQWLDWTEAG